LPVAGQDGTARFTDARPIAFKAVEYADDVFVIVFDKFLAETHDVGAASGALFFISPALSPSRCNGSQRKHYRKSNNAKHDDPSCEKSAVLLPSNRLATKPERVVASPKGKRLSEGFVPRKEQIQFVFRSPIFLRAIQTEHSANFWTPQGESKSAAATGTTGLA
jgi:hypothetical protein